jgi:flagellar hook protein FlgE
MSSPISSSGSAAAIGLSGMRAAQARLDSSAHNVANVQTPGFRRQQVTQSESAAGGGVDVQVQQAALAGGPDGFADLAGDLVEQRISLYSFAANLRTVRTQDDMLGSLLNTQA